MSDPSWAEAWDQAKARVNFFQKLHLFLNNNSPNWLGLEDTLIQALEGEYIGDVITGAKADRAALSAIVSPGNVRARLSPHIYEIARVAGIPERDISAILPELRRYMVANSYSVNSRNLNLGTITADGSNTGTGSIYRLQVDEYDQPLEGIFLEAKTFRCVADQNQVDKHAEVLEYRGTEAELDYLRVPGSGLRVPLTCIHAGAQSTGRFITNPSFEIYAGTAPTAGVPSTPSTVNDLTGWVLTSTANARVLLDTPSPFRGYPGDGVASGSSLYALRFTDNNKIVQTPSNTVAPTWDPTRPVFMSVRVYKESNCDGNIILRLGNTTRTVAMSGLTNSAWNTVTLHADANDNGVWYRQYKKNGLTVELELASRTTGSLVLDDVNIDYWTNPDGLWYAPLGGATPFIFNDFFTWTDALTGSEGIMQYWWWRGGFGSLPSNNAGSETITDPT